MSFSAPGRETSEAHELALAVVFEAGITHFADHLDEYRSRPAALNFLATLPPEWHEVRLLDGHPDQYAVVARRHEDTWFVAAIATGEARTVTLDPAALIPDFTGWLITDNLDGTLAERRLDVRTEPGPLEIPLAHNGGFTLVLAPSGTTIGPAQPRQARPALTIEPARALATHAEGVVMTIEPDASLTATPGWLLEEVAPGAWSVRAPRDAQPGAVGVVTATRATESDVPVVGHAKLTVPLGSGTHQLANLPFLDAHNSLGPIGRNRSNGPGGPNDGDVMTVAGSTYLAGLGVTNSASISFYLGQGNYVLEALVAIDDETPTGQAVVTVLRDGIAADRFEIRSGEQPHAIRVDLTGANTVELRTEPNPAANESASVDWINPRIMCADQTAEV